ncbi:helix-turn-helix transcriptional regulator [Paenibacillus sp. FSL H3-0321]|nr:helix-turn-helix transcriptional regulator [Paenibacillus borealis]
MIATTTIRSELDNLMKQKGWNMSNLGRTIGINVGSISSILKGNKVMSVDQVDRVTAVLSLPAGYFYENYIQESMIEATPNWRRIGPFLYRCAELNKLDCVLKTVTILLEELTYAPLLFDVANDFFKRNWNDSAAILYDNVARCEIRQHSERLAFCQYRLFTLSIGDDQIQNFKAACQFEPFVERLDEKDQLDALKDLANIYRSLRRWDKVEELAQEMGRKARIQYFSKHRKEERMQEDLATSLPLFVYIAYSNLLLASVWDARGDFQQALECTYAYADLSWVKETDPETLHWIELFQHWAQANSYVNKLMAGDQSVLPDYVALIEGKKEIFAELLNIMEAANCYDINVDYILEKFESQILFYEYDLNSDLYTQQVIPEQIARLYYQMSKYYFNKGMYSQGFDYLFESLEKYTTKNNNNAIINCVGLFESFKEYALPETLTQYQKFIQRVWEKNEKEADLYIGSY